MPALRSDVELAEQSSLRADPQPLLFSGEDMAEKIALDGLSPRERLLLSSPDAPRILDVERQRKDASLGRSSGMRGYVQDLVTAQRRFEARRAVAHARLRSGPLHCDQLRARVQPRVRVRSRERRARTCRATRAGPGGDDPPEPADGLDPSGRRSW
jgi:hypothetical protein